MDGVTTGNVEMSDRREDIAPIYRDGIVLSLWGNMTDREDVEVAATFYLRKIVFYMA